MFEAVALFEDAYVALVQLETPLARRGSVTLAELAELPLVAHATTRARVEGHLRARGCDPRFVLESDAGATVQAFVGAGLGAAILPRLAIDVADDQTIALELDAADAVPPRVVALAWNTERRLRRDAAIFADAARATCVELGLERPRASNVGAAA